ncbi:MAG: ACP S-malonyltransferase [Coriobacteriales bacterium]|jgi:[acyl-carrier-protein] S-malonyltransferase|nr:ACP S-malonyltransferase [Coriobacteriales bacterium]
MNGVHNGKTAWLFAGQGSQLPGMGRDIYEQFPQTRAIFASDAAGFDLRKLCFDSPAELLGNTRYTQACMAAFAAAVVLILRERELSCDIAAGLSLGEYSALHAAGVWDAETLIALLGYRGAIMAEASKAAGGKTAAKTPEAADALKTAKDTQVAPAAEPKPVWMLAVFGLAEKAVEETVCEVSQQSGLTLGCTSYNCPGQVVIGGQPQAVVLAQTLLMERGARRCVPLATSGPFHTSLMDGAAVRLAKRLAQTPFKPQRIPVIFNVTGQTANDAEIPGLLARQIASAVRFSQSLQNLTVAGVTRAIEIGPGRVLAGLVRKTAADIEVVSIQTASDLKEVIR